MTLALAVSLLTATPLAARSEANSDFHFDCDLGQRTDHITTESGKLVYRYGSSEMVELTIREDAGRPNVFYRHDRLGSKGEGQQLRFESGRYSYVLSSLFIAGADGSDQVKFFVSQDDKIMRSRLCHLAPSFENLERREQFRRLPHDVMRPLGY